MQQWGRVETHLVECNVALRALSARQLLLIGWEMITAHADRWQIELLLAHCAGFVGAHAASVERLDALMKSGSVPKEQFSKVRRAIFVARRQQRGLPVEW